jgi:hypothetical protein
MKKCGPESPEEQSQKYSDPVRRKAVKQYFASLEKWAAGIGLTKEQAHMRFKEQMNIKHLYEIKTGKLIDIAYELSTIANGGPGM